jgi:hypothetical protein
MELFIVYNEEQDSISGFDISGVFDDLRDAISWAKSEGNGQKIFKTTTGPINWNAMGSSKNQTRWWD